MLKNYLKITFRNLLKNKVFVLINILGMGTAIGCCIVAYLNYDFNVAFDKDLEKKGNIYRVGFIRDIQGEGRRYGMSPMPLGSAIDENISEVGEAVRFIPSGGNFRIKDELFNTNFTFVDDQFLKLFDFHLVKGNPDGLNDKSNIYISEEQATKYFADEDPIGQLLTHLTDDGPKDYTVAGVFKDMPLNSSFAHVEVITNIENYFDLNKKEDVENSWMHWVTLFITFDNPERLKTIESQLNQYVEIQNKARLDLPVKEYYVESIKGMAHRAANDQVYGHWTASSLPPPAVVVPAVMALLILLIACFNFTNTSIAISSKRLKEIGLRKVMGGIRQQLVIQFMLENVLLCFLSLLVGLVVAAFLVPAYSQMWPFLDIDLTLFDNTGFFIFLISLLLFIGILAGSYPALYISKFQPASILKGTLKLGGSTKLTSTLLTLQFSISLIAIILGFIFFQNAEYQKNMDFGFDKNGAISVRINNEDEYRAYESLINQDNRIKSIAASEDQIMGSYRNDPLKTEDKEFDADMLHVGENYIETMNFTIVEGRGFRKDSETDQLESALVSEEFVKTCGWENPIGKKITWMDSVNFYVVGVVKDVYINGIWDPIDPLLIHYAAPKEYKYITVKTSSADLVAVNEMMEDKWKQLFPDRMYSGFYMDEDMGETSLINTNLLKLFGFLGVVATLLSAIGLFSLVSLSIVKRMKEIGVRKVLGASVSSIIAILNRNFIIILIIAAVIGSTASYFLANALMDSIWAYHMTPGMSAFVASVVILFTISAITVGAKVFKAASANPVSTLRSE